MMLWGRSGAGVHGGGTDEMWCGWRSEGEGPSWNDAGLDARKGRALLQPGHPLLNGFQSQQAHRPQRRPLSVAAVRKVLALHDLLHNVICVDPSVIHPGRVALHRVLLPPK